NTIDVEESDENSPPDDWFYNADITGQPAPKVFFTDIDGGANSGGETVGAYSGAYVTIYGNNFGLSQGTSTVSWNGLSCLRVASWGATFLWYQKIVVQLGTG